jgi:hypothetical protein
VITLSVISQEPLPAVDQAPQSPDATSELAASFVALLIGLQQQPQAAPQLASVVVPPPSAAAPEVEALKCPAQSLPIVPVLGTPSKRLAQFPMPLSTRPAADDLADTSAGATTTPILSPKTSLDFAGLEPMLRNGGGRLQPISVPQEAGLPGRDKSAPLHLDAGLDPRAGLSGPITVAFSVTQKAMPTAAGTPQFLQPQVPPVNPGAQNATVQLALAPPVAPPTTDSAVAPIFLPPRTAAVNDVAPGPVSPIAEALPAVPAAAAPAVQPHYEVAAGVTAATPAIAAVSAKAAVKTVSEPTHADELADSPDRPSDSAGERPLPPAPMPHTSGFPVAVSDTTSATAPAEVRQTTSASAVRETVEPDSHAPAVTHLRVELAPPLLGDVVLELRHEREKITATAIVDRPATAEALKMVQAQVQQVLADQGIHVGSFEVSCRDGRPGSDSRPPAQTRTTGGSEQQVSAEPRKATSESSNTLVDRYA